MARQVVQLIQCDVCGIDITHNAKAEELRLGSRQWSLDLCETHHQSILDAIEEWTSNAEPSTTSSKTKGKRPRTNESDWAYLTSLGFERHRGRKSTAEIEALRSRPEG